MDAMPPERHGEAFGWYGAAQMSGLLLGPAIGGLGAAAFGGIGFVFVFGGVTGVLAAVAVGLTVRDVPHRSSVAPLPGSGMVDFSRDLPRISDDDASATAPRTLPDGTAEGGPAAYRANIAAIRNAAALARGEAA